MSEHVLQDIWEDFWDDTKKSILHYINVVDDGSYFNLFPPVRDRLVDDVRAYSADDVSEELVRVSDAPEHIREQIDERYLPDIYELYPDLDDDRALIAAAMVFVMDII